MKDPHAGEFYTTEEAARILGISADAVLRRIKSKQLDAVKRSYPDIFGHVALRWHIPKSALRPREVADVTTAKGDYDVSVFRDVMCELLTERLDVFVRTVDERLNETDERIDQLRRAITSMPAAIAPEVVAALRTQLKAIEIELADIKEGVDNASIDNAVRSAQTASNFLMAYMNRASRWQRFVNRISGRQLEKE